MARNAARCMGWIIPDQAVKFENLSATDSSYTQAGPHGGGSGTPVDTSTQAAIEVSGDQDTTLVVKVENGGLPRLGPTGARISYRKSSEATTATRGWETPNVLTGAGSSPLYSTSTYSAMDLIALRTGTLLMCYRTGATLSIQSYDPDTNVWTDLSAYIPQTGVTTGACFAQDADGRIIMVVQNANTGGTWNTYRSVNADSITGGWTAIGIAVMAINLSPDKMRLFILPNGDWSLWLLSLSGTNLSIDQYASDSKGAQFTLIKQYTAGTYYYSGDVVMSGTGKLNFICANAAPGDLYAVPVGSAWEPLGIPASGVIVTATDSRDTFACADPNGRIYVWPRSDVGQSTIRCLYSDDDGATWTAHTYPLFSAEATGDDDPHLTLGRVVHCGGTYYLAAQCVDAATTRSFLFYKLGGYSNVLMRNAGSSAATAMDVSRPGTGGDSNGGCSWTATSLPAAQGCWTRTTSGGTEVLTSPGQNVLTNAGNTMYYAAAAPGNHGIFGRFSLLVSSGGSTVARGCGVDLTTSTGATACQIQLWCSTTAFVVRDDTATRATITIDMAQTMQFMILLCAAGSTTVEVYYKRPTSETWTLAYATTAANTFASASNIGQWGHVANVTATSKWDYASIITGGGLGSWASPLSSSPYATSWTVGRLVSSLPVPLGVRAATGQKVTYVRLTDGPGCVGDSWTVAPRYDHGVENLHWQRQPSPRRTWRSTQTAADESISWDLTTTQDTTLGQYIAFALLNINFASAKLQAQTHASGGWVDLATLDATKGFASLGWHRAGGSDRVTVVSTSGAAGRYVQADEFVGCTVNLGGKLRRIRAHTEGTWTGNVVAVGGRAVELWLDGMDGTEGTGGFLDIWAKNAVVFLHPTIGNHYRRWRLTITAQTTYEGYFEIGNFLPGHLFVAGLFPTWSTVTAYGMNSASSESADLVVRTKEKGPPRRTLTWDWSDGADQTGLRSTAAIPDFLTPDPSATDGIAAWLDVPFKLAALLRHCKSGEIPVVACSQIPALSGATAVTVTDPSLFLYCRIAGDISLEHVQGDEGVDEVYRVGAFPVVELV